MFCDPLQKQALTCPDVYCPSSNFTYIACNYSIAKNSNNQTAFSYDSCADASKIDCAQFKNCAQLIIYVSQHGVNGSSAASNQTSVVPRCMAGHLSDTNGAASNVSGGAGGSSVASSTSTTSLAISTHHEMMCTSILFFLCLLTITMSKRIF